jgi:hypothetical protein
MKNVAFAFVGDLAIAVYGAENPTDEEIAESLQAFAPLNKERVRSLIVSDGGAPSALQREQLINSVGGHAHRSAVVTDAGKVRGAVTALSWFNKNIKAFPKAKLADALVYLNVPAAQHDQVQREIRRLEAEVK